MFRRRSASLIRLESIRESYINPPPAQRYAPRDSETNKKSINGFNYLLLNIPIPITMSCWLQRELTQLETMYRPWQASNNVSLTPAMRDQERNLTFSARTAAGRILQMHWPPYSTNTIPLALKLFISNDEKPRMLPCINTRRPHWQQARDAAIEATATQCCWPTAVRYGLRFNALPMNN